MNDDAVLEHSKITYHAVLIRHNALVHAWVPAAVNIALKPEIARTVTTQILTSAPLTAAEHAHA